MRLIDADALIENKFKNDISYNAFVSLVKRQPSAQPERIRGRWVDCNNSEHWKCSQCGCRAGYWFNEENSSSYETDMSEWLSDFCPNCGADMREDCYCLIVEMARSKEDKE